MAAKKSSSSKKNTKKVLDKKVKVHGKKFTVRQLLIITLIVVILAAGFCVYAHYNPFIELYLLGSTTTEIHQGEKYEEPGWVFTYNLQEVSDEYVTVTYKNEAGQIVSTIDSSEVSTYTVVYFFEYERVSETLVRTVNVVDAAIEVSLNGANVLSVNKNSNYVDQGIQLTVNGNIVTPDSVKISYKDENNDVIPRIDTSVEGTYTVTYLVTYGTYTTTISRTVVVAIQLETEAFQMHFLQLGNDYTGDSVYVKVGDNDILIDAGSRQGSATTIKSYIDQYCTDGKLEYVIITHGDQDHIAGFYGNTSGSSRTGILYQYEIGTVIMNELTSKTTSIYNNVKTSIQSLVANGTQLHYAADCWNNVNGAQRTYTLSENVTMDIVYNKYYFETASDENDYSVCTMFNYGDKHFFLTGDLEKHGEEALAAYYDGSTPEKTLPHCDLFKAGHHGSKTSSNDCLLEKITPDIVTVCCCAGSTEYTPNYNNVFPTQEFINRVAKYTDQVYVTSYFDEKLLEFKPLNGDIIVTYNGVDLKVQGTNNTIKLKDTTWFNETVYVKSNDSIVSKSGATDFFTATTEGVTAVPRRIWPTYQ